MKTIKCLTIAAVLLSGSLFLTGCEKKKPKTTGPTAIKPVTSIRPIPAPVTKPVPVPDRPVVRVTDKPGPPDRGIGRPVKPPKPPKPTSYTIKKGDTLWSIAKKYLGDGQRWRDIVAANPGLAPAKLRVGQKINLPQK